MRSVLLARLVDVHCHIFDDSANSPRDDQFDFSGQLSTVVSRMSAQPLRTLADRFPAQCVMSSTLPSQSIVETRSEISDSIIPFYGVHPWFTHHLSISSSSPPSPDSKSAHYQKVFECNQISLQPYFDRLPDPIPLDSFLDDVERRLLANSRAQVGEVGLDRIFKLPFSIANYSPAPSVDPTASQSHSCNCHTSEPSAATPQLATNDRRDRPKILKTALHHQQTILAAQIKLAIKHKRSVSCHSVQSSEAIIDAFRKLKAADEVGWSRTAVCLHSFGGSAESARVLQKGAI